MTPVLRRYATAEHTPSRASTRNGGRHASERSTEKQLLKVIIKVLFLHYLFCVEGTQHTRGGQKTPCRIQLSPSVSSSRDWTRADKPCHLYPLRYLGGHWCRGLKPIPTSGSQRVPSLTQELQQLRLQPGAGGRDQPAIREHRDEGNRLLSLGIGSHR